MVEGNVEREAQSIEKEVKKFFNNFLHPRNTFANAIVRSLLFEPLQD